jgi:nucleoside-diphosphate-sugar epimerase
VLPRPVVIEGSLAEVDLGLDGGSRRWIGRHCDRVLHNAASLTFHATPDGEPYLSNVEGTERLLELCRDMGIRQFHYVSTAYVCGLRGDRCREAELDVGQPFGNDYERSKVQAETMVRQAKYLDRPTIFRPAIIVGDSESGYTSTFHGFYALLKLAHTLARWIARGSTSADALIAAFELSGDERKNFVPVDWVSAVMTHVLGRPEHHGKTYHLVARKPLLLCRMAQVIQEAVEAYSTLADEDDATRCDGEWFQEAFKEQLEIYRPYWRDDPEFDYANTAAAAPHLPCPAMDGTMAMRLAKYAIETNFGKRRRRLLKPEFDVHQHLQRFSRSGELAAPHANGNGNGRACLGLQVDGPGGGQWKLLLNNGSPMVVQRGIGRQCTATFRLDTKTFRRLRDCHLSVRGAVESGHVVIEGNGMERRRLESVLEAVVVAGAAGGGHGLAATAGRL